MKVKVQLDDVDILLLPPSHHSLEPARARSSSTMMGGTNLMRALRSEAPTLTRRLFECQCRRSGQLLQKTARDTFKRHASTRPSPGHPSVQRKSLTSVLPQRCFSSTFSRAAKETVKSKPFFPPRTSKAVGFWLLGSAASVFGIVVFGGLTRLTESGYDPHLFLG